MPSNLMTLVESVLAQRRALAEREQQFIDSLNRVLPDMGYRVVSTSNGSAAPTGVASRRGRPGSSASSVAGSPPRNLVCAECGRRFSLPLHLGRHMAAMHKSSATPPKASSGTPRRRRRARAASHAKPS